MGILLKKRSKNYLYLENFTKPYEHVNIFQGPVLGPWEGAEALRSAGGQVFPGKSQSGFRVTAA